MNISSLTFRDLQYLKALSEQKNFGKAAKVCFVTQPALSAQIKKIEGYFGKALFERQNQGVFLTPEGIKVLQIVNFLLQEAKQMEELFQGEKKLLSADFNLGVIQTLSPYYPPYFLSDMKKKYPHIKLNLRDGMTEHLIAELKSGQLDAVIASEVFTDSKCDSYPLFREPLYLAVNSHHSFFSNQLVFTKDLNTEEMLFLSDGNCLKDESIDLCPKNRRGHIHHSPASSLEMLKQMVAMQKTMAIIPALASEISPKLKNMVSVKKFHGQEKIYRQISFFIRQETPRKQDCLAFLKVLMEQIPFF